MARIAICLAGFVLASICGLALCRAATADAAAAPKSGVVQWKNLLPGPGMTGWRKNTGQWKMVGEATKDPNDEKKIATKPGVGVIINGDKGSTNNIFTELEHGDAEVHVEFMIPKGSNSGIYFMGRYEIQVYDSFGVEKDQYPGIECGGIYPRWQNNHEVEGHTPMVNASLPPGEWQSFDVVFLAPRFGADGKKTANAKFVKVVHNGKLIHENIEVTGPTRAAAFEDEKPTGPLMLQGDHGPVAYRNLRIVPLGRGSESGTSLSRSSVVSGQGYFPVALRLADGRIAVVLRGGAPHLGIKGRLDMVFSADGGKTWSKPIVVADSPADDRNPALGQARDGTLVVAYWRTARYDDRGQYSPNLDKPINTWLTRSSDGGKTWSESAEIDVSDIGWGSPYGKMLTLADGSMLMSIYGGPVGGGAGDCSYLYRSTDNGKTFRRFAQIAKGFNETSVVRLKSGALLAALRSEKREQDTWLSKSADEGKTWSTPEKLTPPTVHPADLVLLEDGQVFMAVGFRAGPFGVRGLIGDETGRFDWEKRIVLVDDATNGDCGYPSSVLLRDGRVLTVYYAVGSKGHPDWGTHSGAVISRP